MPPVSPWVGVDPDILKRACESIFTDIDQLERHRNQDHIGALVKIRADAEYLFKICIQVKAEAESERSGEKSTHSWPLKDQQSLLSIRLHVDAIVSRCYGKTVRPLQETLRKLVPTTLSGLSHAAMHVSQEQLSLYSDADITLKLQAQALRMLHTAISYAFARRESSSSGEPIKFANETAAKLQNLIAILKEDLNSKSIEYHEFPNDDIQQLRSALEATESMGEPWPKSSKNEHFVINRSPSPQYTGRVKELKAIREAFDSASSERFQRRYIIQGTPGSGKTDLALKFADEEKHRYWGVFWVDASSRENALGSFKRIAKVDGVEATNFWPVKNWLSSRSDAFEWLLIIDNADEDEGWVEELFPPGHKGCVLVTTRNLSQLKFGTVGEVSLKGMDDEEEASMLLLLVAHISKSERTAAVVDAAKAVCKYLNFLPLALVQAGKAVAQRLCDLPGYITFVEKTIKRIRRQWNRLQRQGGSSHLARYSIADDEEATNIFGTYEVLYDSLEGAVVKYRNEQNPRKIEGCEDALQILQVFSYMHFQNIRLDMLVYAATNPIREAREAFSAQIEEDAIIRKLGISKERTWSQALQDLVRNILGRVDLPPVLPDALKNPDGLEVDELEEAVLDRLYMAMRELEARGLVARSNDDGIHRFVDREARYHMHPMVHRWVRERPHLPAAKDGLFCQLAKTVLSRAVRLEGKDGEGEQTMRLELKPHIDHVRECDAIISQRIQANHGRRRSTWLQRTLFGLPYAVDPSFGKLQALENAKFGKIYMECGQFSIAEELLREVHAFTAPRLGPDHEIVHRVKLAIAKSLENQTRHNDAEELKRDVYESRKKTLGPEHPRTLEIMRELGTSVLFQGRITDSLKLCTAARDGLLKAYGPKHVETLKCISQIGKIHYFYLNLDKSLSYHEKAFLEAESLDPEHALPELQHLLLKEEFAMASVQVRKGKGDLEKAEKMLKDVVNRRTTLMGKENPFTLLAKGNLGRAFAALQRFDEAVNIISTSIETAERSLGSTHLGVLAGKTWLGQTLMAKGDPGLAEPHIREATHKEHYRAASGRDGEYQDRIMAVWTLTQCLEQQDKLEEATKELRQLERSIPEVGGHGLGGKHKLLSKVIAKAEEIEKRLMMRRQTEIVAEAFTEKESGSRPQRSESSI